MKAASDFLHNDEIEEIVYSGMPVGEWVDLAYIYDLVEYAAELTDADWEPAAAGTSDPRWRRNVRNFLQARKGVGELDWNGEGRYRLRGATPEEPQADLEPLQQAGLRFEVGRVYRRQEIHDRYGDQRYGGISTPTKHPIVILISGEDGASFGYDDQELEDGSMFYFGEGQVGPMEFTRGNAAIRDHADAGEDLHLFRKVRDGYVRYVGQFVYAGHQLREGVLDRDGAERQGIVFHLVPIEQLADESLPDESDELEAVDLDALRAAALGDSGEESTPTQGRRNIWKRSRAVRAYVLARANGVCEGCTTAAPFTRPNGEPYLEPHHTRRISDGGPDHPRWVIALCPTCHRRVHHGSDGALYNGELEAKLGGIEAVPAGRS